MGLPKKVSKQDAIDMAADLAKGVDGLEALAQKYGISHEYMRQISCSQKRPEIRKLADDIANENIRTAIRLAKSHSRVCMANLVSIAVNKPDKKTGKRAFDGHLQRAAATDVIEFAMRDMTDLNTTVHKHEGSVVLLTDILNEAGVTGLNDPRLGRLDDWEKPDAEEKTHSAGSNGKVAQQVAGENGNGNGSHH